MDGQTESILLQSRLLSTHRNEMAPGRLCGSALHWFLPDLLLNIQPDSAYFFTAGRGLGGSGKKESRSFIFFFHLWCFKTICAPRDILGDLYFSLFMARDLDAINTPYRAKWVSLIHEVSVTPPLALLAVMDFSH